MKKTAVVLFAACTFFVAGCATTGAADGTSAANTPMTLEEALQKSAETRQKLIDAKKMYEAAKTSSQTGEDVSSALAKQALQNQVDSTKRQIEDEKNAWKEVFSF